MKMPLQTGFLLAGSRTTRSTQSGIASVVVLILLFLMVAFLAGNSVVLSSLKRELVRLDRIQARQYPPPARTNSPPPAPAPVAPR